MSMKLESQVTSLDLAKRLKELGVKQESAFAWTAMSHMPDTKWKLWGTGSSVEEWVSDGRVAAFTVAELGEILRKNYYAKWRTEWAEARVSRLYSDESWEGILQIGADEDGNLVREYFPSDTEADARAEMLIYLLETHLLDTTK